MAGLKSEYMADIASEQLADFIGIRRQTAPGGRTTFTRMTASA
jgi:hypothetical protein